MKLFLEFIWVKLFSILTTDKKTVIVLVYWIISRVISNQKYYVNLLPNNYRLKMLKHIAEIPTIFNLIVHQNDHATKKAQPQLICSRKSRFCIPMINIMVCTYSCQLPIAWYISIANKTVLQVSYVSARSTAVTLLPADPFTPFKHK